ncbi:MAG: hypothetical protein GC204_11920 [Chloroflexi bacterium]|nr:hypothetical protein [Chloroflexota bacterium]
MSASWSLTYLQTDLSERALFDTLLPLFDAELTGKLYGYAWADNPADSWNTIKLETREIEWFETPKRAKMIMDAVINEPYGRGILIYPRKNGLICLADSLMQMDGVLNSSRTRRVEWAKILTDKPDPMFGLMPLYMDVLKRLTELAHAEAANIIFERNPAGGATAVHFYKAGELVDEFYAEHLDADETYDNLIELPQHPEIVASLLGGRFAFLLDQPKRWSYGAGEAAVDVYFDGEDLSMTLPEYDAFNLRDSDLYVPFWDETILPLGAVYCFNGKFPKYFLQRYEPPASRLP